MNTSEKHWAGQEICNLLVGRPQFNSDEIMTSTEKKVYLFPKMQQVLSWNGRQSTRESFRSDSIPSI